MLHARCLAKYTTTSLKYLCVQCVCPIEQRGNDMAGPRDRQHASVCAGAPEAMQLERYILRSKDGMHVLVHHCIVAQLALYPPQCLSLDI